MTTNRTPLVTLENVTCGYDHKIILRDVNLELQPGSFTGLVGPSGAGKTTLLRLILGQLKPISGQVKFNKSQGIGYVPQLETVDWNFPITVEQAVLMGRIRTMGWLPWPSAEDLRKLAELLERLGLGHVAKQGIRELSGGQQQRVFLARALISNPALLVLDEPTSGIDIKTRAEILTLLRELNQQGITILMTTHDLHGVAASLPYIVCVNGGIIAQDTPDVVFNAKVLSQTYNAPMEVIRHEGHLLVVEQSPA
jgi:zinc/manganese transport system ATP-binding protein/zinc transport system ATP-binding protein